MSLCVKRSKEDRQTYRNTEKRTEREWDRNKVAERNKEVKTRK